MFRNLFNKKESRPALFIHVPKCGGSTFVGLLKDSFKLEAAQKRIPTHLIENVGNVEIKHVNFKYPDRPFKSPDIFDDSKNDVYLDKDIFLLLRDPVKRLYSEFNFQFHILDGKSGDPKAAILAKLKPRPKTFEQYIRFPAVQNYQCKFLLGRKLADPKKLTEEEFQRIIQAIENLNIHCGITSAYQEFLDGFQSITKLKLKLKATQRKQTPQSLKSEIPDKLQQKILSLNTFDKRLFDFVSERNNKGNKVIKPIVLESRDEFIV